MAVAAVGYAITGDFMPTFGSDGYAAQRFVSLIIALTIIGARTTSAVPISQKARFSAAASGLIFALLALIPYPANSGNPFYWVEPLYFASCAASIFLASQSLIISGQFIPHIRFTTMTLASGCGLYAGISLMLVIFALLDPLAPPLASIFPWGSVNIRYWSHLATWILPLIPLATSMLLETKKPTIARLLAVSSAIWWWIAISSGARGTIVAILTACLITAWIFRRAGRKQALLIFQQALAGLLIFFFSLFVESWRGNFDLSEASYSLARASSSGRLELWQEAWAMSVANFPFGMGAQSWLTHSPITSNYQSANRHFGHPHNMYLWLVAEYGWAVFVVFLIPAARVFQRLSAIAIGNVGSGTIQARAQAAFFASSLSALIHALVSAVFVNPASILLAMVILPTSWALLAAPAPQCAPPSATSGKGKRLVGALAFGIFAVVSIKFNCDYYQAMRIDELRLARSAAPYHQPRYWIHGNFPHRPDK